MRYNKFMGAILAGAEVLNQCSASDHPKHDDVHQELSIPKPVTRTADYIVWTTLDPGPWQMVLRDSVTGAPVDYDGTVRPRSELSFKFPSHDLGKSQGLSDFLDEQYSNGPTSMKQAAKTIMQNLNVIAKTKFPITNNR